MQSFWTERDTGYHELREQHLKELATGRPLSYLVDNFARFTRRQELTRFLVRHELFKKVLDIKGSIVECGVYAGNGVMSWAQLSAIYEPVAFWRRIYGFDTFQGFPSVHGHDRPESREGDLKDDCYNELQRAVELYDKNRFLPHMPKVSLIRGDFNVTGEAFLKDEPHVLIALLYLDFDLYEPTKKALELFLPRMARGSVLCFDEINNPSWPGETRALLEMMDLRQIKIEKFPYEPHMAYIVL